MKTKIKEIQDYFKQKLLNSEFDVKIISEHYIELTIDKLYDFTIWTANLGIQYSCRQYKYGFNFLELNLSQENKEDLKNILKPIIVKFKKDLLLVEKTKELELLKSEINDLNLEQNGDN